MNRRGFLASFGGGVTVALAGCTVLEGFTSSTPDEIEYEVTADEVPDESPLHHNVAIQQQYFRSADAPFTLELSVTNATDEVIEYKDSRTALGKSVSDESHDFTMLSEDDGRYGFNSEKDIWMTTHTIGGDGEYRSGTIDPSETHSQPLVVVAKEDEGAPEKIPSEIKFIIRFVAAPPEELIASKDKFRFRWPFVLQRQ